jgi:hypothetical protein
MAYFMMCRLFLHVLALFGAPEKIRTPDPQIRKLWEPMRVARQIALSIGFQILTADSQIYLIEFQR